MVLPFNINVNVNGIPCLRSQAVSVSTTAVTFDFNQHTNVGRPFAGLIIIDLAQAIPAGTTDTLPIIFTSGGGGNGQALVKENGEPVTVADIIGTGIYILFYNSQNNSLVVPNRLT